MNTSLQDLLDPSFLRPNLLFSSTEPSAAELKVLFATQKKFTEYYSSSNRSLLDHIVYECHASAHLATCAHIFPSVALILFDLEFFRLADRVTDCIEQLFFSQGVPKDKVSQLCARVLFHAGVRNGVFFDLGAMPPAWHPMLVSELPKAQAQFGVSVMFVLAHETEHVALLDTASGGHMNVPEAENQTEDCRVPFLTVASRIGLSSSTTMDVFIRSQQKRDANGARANFSAESSCDARAIPYALLYGNELRIHVLDVCSALFGALTSQYLLQATEALLEQFTRRAVTVNVLQLLGELREREVRTWMLLFGILRELLPEGEPTLKEITRLRFAAVHLADLVIDEIHTALQMLGSEVSLGMAAYRDIVKQWGYAPEPLFQCFWSEMFNSLELPRSPAEHTSW